MIDKFDKQRNLNRIKAIEGLINFKEGAYLSATQLNANFDLLTNVSGEILEYINVIVDEFNNIEKVIAKDANSKFSIEQIRLERPMLNIGTITIDKNINVERTRVFLGLRFEGGGLNSPSSDNITLDIDTTQVSGNLPVRFQINNTGTSYNYDAFYTHVETETNHVYTLYLSPSLDDSLTGMYEWDAPQMSIFRTMYYNTNNVVFTLNGEPRDTTYNIIDWNLEGNPNNDINYVKAQRVSLDYDNTIEFLNEFVEQFTTLQTDVDVLNSLIKESPITKETIIYGRDYNDPAMFAKKEIITQSSREGILISEVINDTNLEGTTAADVVENLDARIDNLESIPNTFGNGTTVDNQDKPINTASDLPFISTVNIPETEVQSAITNLAIKSDTNDAKHDSDIHDINNRVDYIYGYFSDGNLKASSIISDYADETGNILPWREDILINRTNITLKANQSDLLALEDKVDINTTDIAENVSDITVNLNKNQQQDIRLGLLEEALAGVTTDYAIVRADGTATGTPVIIVPETIIKDFDSTDLAESIIDGTTGELTVDIKKDVVVEYEGYLRIRENLSFPGVSGTVIIEYFDVTTNTVVDDTSYTFNFSSQSVIDLPTRVIVGEASAGDTIAIRIKTDGATIDYVNMSFRLEVRAKQGVLQSVIDAEVVSTSDVGGLNTKEDLNILNTELTTKADQTDLDTAVSDINNSLATKADKSYVDAQDALKADKANYDIYNSTVPKIQVGGNIYFGQQDANSFHIGNSNVSANMMISNSVGKHDFDNTGYSGFGKGHYFNVTTAGDASDYKFGIVDSGLIFRPNGVGDFVKLEDYFATTLETSSDLSEIQSQITSNDNDITVLQDKDLDLQNQITSNDTDISNLQNQITSNDTDISNLQDQITSNDTDITNLSDGKTDKVFLDTANNVSTLYTTRFTTGGYRSGISAVGDNTVLQTGFESTGSLTTNEGKLKLFQAGVDKGFVAGTADLKTVKYQTVQVVMTQAQLNGAGDLAMLRFKPGTAMYDLGGSVSIGIEKQTDANNFWPSISTQGGTLQVPAMSLRPSKAWGQYLRLLAPDVEIPADKDLLKIVGDTTNGNVRIDVDADNWGTAITQNWVANITVPVYEAGEWELQPGFTLGPWMS